jgi:hypothetical protein
MEHKSQGSNEFLDVSYTRDRRELKQLNALEYHSGVYLGYCGISQGLLSILLKRKIKIQYKNSQCKISVWTQITFTSNQSSVCALQHFPNTGIH